MLSSPEGTKREFYGGTTKEEIIDRTNDRIGIHHWTRQGITGRAVLIDYATWAESKGIEYSAFSLHTIKLQDIKDIAEEKNIVFKKGDVLLIRSGMTKEWEHKMDLAAKKAYQAADSPHHAGVEATTDMLRWIWDTGFAAVAGDAISFEVFPPVGDITLHDYFLAGWGMPIGTFTFHLGLFPEFELEMTLPPPPSHLNTRTNMGDSLLGEMFDLERLAEVCKDLGRWTFFFASMPINMPGGVSSPPNAQAIF